MLQELLVVVLIGFNTPIADQAISQKSAMESGVTHLVFRIEPQPEVGPLTVMRFAQVLRNGEGISEVRIDLARNQVHVEVDPERFSSKKLRERLVRLGYRLR